MCGIFAIVSSKINDKMDEYYLPYFERIQHRGPDFSSYEQIDNKVIMGFHRLAIIDPHETSNQPLFAYYYEDDNKIEYPVMLICNGEIFNYKYLIKYLEETTEFEKDILSSNSDCEIILYLYLYLGIKETLKLLDAEFSFILYDTYKNKVYAARDCFGVRPLFYGFEDSKENTILLSSEVKGIYTEKGFGFKPFPPSSFMEIDFNNETLEQNNFSKKNYLSFNINKYFNIDKYLLKPDINTNINPYNTFSHLKEFKLNINSLLKKAVEKRLMSDRPIGCLLSGGLDSSLITSLVHKHLPDVKCFSIGLKGSVDIKAAKKVVKFLQIPKENHHIVNFTIEEGIQAISDLIYHLESYDITTIRASTPQYLLSQYIKRYTDVRVLYTGEGADELFAGYQYSKMAPNAIDLHNDSIRLLKELYLYDNLRTDRTTASQGLEVRVPFLDKELVNYVLYLPPDFIKPLVSFNEIDDYKKSQVENKIEKLLLRSSFEEDNLLPDEILWRHKEAFSDAVSSTKTSWYVELNKYINTVISDEKFSEEVNKFEFNKPETKEALYYRSIFQKHFPNQDQLIDHYWLPKWCGDIKDPSATILNCHKGDLS